MATKDVTVKILADLSELQNQLKNIKITAKLDTSGELKQLLDLAKNPITIKFNVPQEIKDLVQLAKSGINIKVNAPSGGGGSSINSGSSQSLAQYMEQEQKRLEAVFAASNKARIEAVNRELKSAFQNQAIRANTIDESYSRSQSQFLTPSIISQYTGQAASSSPLNSLAAREQFIQNELKLQRIRQARINEEIAAESKLRQIAQKRIDAANKEFDIAFGKSFNYQVQDEFDTRRNINSFTVPERNYARQVRQPSQGGAAFNKAFGEEYNTPTVKSFTAAVDREQVAYNQAIERNKELDQRVQQAKAKQAEAIEAANRKLKKLGPLDVLTGEFEDERRTLAKKGGFNVSKLISSPSFFDPDALFKDKNTLSTVLLGGLLGGPTNLIGGALGAVSIKGHTGAIAGALGANVFVSAFERVTGALQEAAEKGLQFERSITGISSVLQTSTRFVSGSGADLPIGQQINLQRGEARSIQTAARSRLLPLGIAGSEESLLVQRVISGFAQRGISLTPEQASTIAARLGGAGQTLLGSQFLSSPQGVRDIEDVILGVNRGQLNLAIRGFTPGLANATTAEEFIKRSAGLENIISANANSNSPDVVLKRLGAAIDNFQTLVGDELVTATVPGLKSLASALSDPALIEGPKAFAKGIGEFVSKLSGFAAIAIDAVATLNSEDGKKRPTKQLTRLGKLTGELTGNTQLTEISSNPLVSDIADYTDYLLQQKKKQEDESNFQKIISVLPKTLQTQIKTARGIYDALSAPKPEDAKKENSAVSALLKETNEYGVDANKVGETLENKLGSSNLSYLVAGRTGLANIANLKNIKREDVEGVNELRLKYAILQSAGLEGAQTLGKSLYNTNTLSGQIGQTSFEQSLIPKQVQSQDQIIDALKATITKDTSAKQAEAINLKILEQEAKKVELLNQQIQANDKLISLERQRNDLILKTFDTFTFSGRLGQTQAANNSNLVEAARLNQIPESQLTDEQRARKGELAVQRAGFQRENVNTRIDQSASQLRFKDSLAAYADYQKEAAEKTQSFADEITKATQAVSDFKDEARLRALGKQGEVLSAADKVASLGGSPESYLAGTGVASYLVKGSSSYNAEARADFERDLATEQLSSVSRRNDVFRLGKEEEIQGRELQFGENRAERAPAALERETRNRTLSQYIDAVGLQQKLGAGTNPLVDQAVKDLQGQSNALFKQAGVEVPNLIKLPEQLKGNLPALGGGLTGEAQKVAQGLNALINPLDNLKKKLDEVTGVKTSGATETSTGGGAGSGVGGGQGFGKGAGRGNSLGSSTVNSSVADWLAPNQENNPLFSDLPSLLNPGQEKTNPLFGDYTWKEKQAMYLKNSYSIWDRDNQKGTPYKEEEPELKYLDGFSVGLKNIDNEKARSTVGAALLGATSGVTDTAGTNFGSAVKNKNNVELGSDLLNAFGGDSDKVKNIAGAAKSHGDSTKEAIQAIEKLQKDAPKPLSKQDSVDSTYTGVYRALSEHFN